MAVLLTAHLKTLLRVQQQIGMEQAQEVPPLPRSPPLTQLPLMPTRFLLRQLEGFFKGNRQETWRDLVGRFAWQLSESNIALEEGFTSPPPAPNPQHPKRTYVRMTGMVAAEDGRSLPPRSLYVFTEGNVAQPKAGPQRRSFDVFCFLLVPGVSIESALRTEPIEVRNGVVMVMGHDERLAPYLTNLQAPFRWSGVSINKMLVFLLPGALLGWQDVDFVQALLEELVRQLGDDQSTFNQKKSVSRIERGCDLQYQMIAAINRPFVVAHDAVLKSSAAEYFAQVPAELETGTYPVMLIPVIQANAAGIYLVMEDWLQGEPPRNVIYAYLLGPSDLTLSQVCREEPVQWRWDAERGTLVPLVYPDPLDNSREPCIIEHREWLSRLYCTMGERCLPVNEVHSWLLPPAPSDEMLLSYLQGLCVNLSATINLFPQGFSPLARKISRVGLGAAFWRHLWEPEYARWIMTACRPAIGNACEPYPFWLGNVPVSLSEVTTAPVDLQLLMILLLRKDALKSLLQRCQTLFGQAVWQKRFSRSEIDNGLLCVFEIINHRETHLTVDEDPDCADCQRLQSNSLEGHAAKIIGLLAELIREWGDPNTDLVQHAVILQALLCEVKDDDPDTQGADRITVRARLQRAINMIDRFFQCFGPQILKARCWRPLLSCHPVGESTEVAKAAQSSVEGVGFNIFEEDEEE